MPIAVATSASTPQDGLRQEALRCVPENPGGENVQEPGSPAIPSVSGHHPAVRKGVGIRGLHQRWKLPTGNNAHPRNWTSIGWASSGQVHSSLEEAGVDMLELARQLDLSCTYVSLSDHRKIPSGCGVKIRNPVAARVIA